MRSPVKVVGGCCGEFASVSRFASVSYKTKVQVNVKVKTAGSRPGSRHPFYELTKRVQKAAKLVLAHRISLLRAGVLMSLLCFGGCHRPFGRRMLRCFSRGVERISALQFWRPSGTNFDTSELFHGLSGGRRFAKGQTDVSAQVRICTQSPSFRSRSGAGQRQSPITPNPSLGKEGNCLCIPTRERGNEIEISP